MRRLGKNIHGYQGEQIDIQSILEELKDAAMRTGWRPDHFSITPKIELLAYHRASAQPQKNVYISTGIHGDEPAGPLALLKLIQENRWPQDVDLWLCPCLNLTGFPLNRRENVNGVDLNRDYRHLMTDEVKTHVAWLRQKPQFDVALCLHEDWEANGFYLYELNPDQRPSLAEKIIRHVSGVCPIEPGPKVDDWPVQGGIVRPDVSPEDRPQWPEAIFLVSHKTRQSYTFETPSDFPLSMRVNAQMAGVQAVLESI